MEKYEEALERIGLTKNEVKVYLALLRMEKASVVDLTKKSGVHRVNVYDVISRLIDKGLISTVMKSNKRIFQAANPEQLFDLLNEKQEQLQRVMPELKKEFKSEGKKQEVYHFFGREGIMRAYYMMLDQNKMIYGWGGSGVTRKYLEHRHEMWNKERLRRKIKGKNLYFEFTRKKKSELAWDDPSMEIKYLPDEFRTPALVDIAGDLVVNLIPVENELAAIVIENKELAETYRRFFEFMWKFAKD
jgi:sugar-specific transcriptional regulator TrmB